jgi:hypothetical protein
MGLGVGLHCLVPRVRVRLRTHGRLRDELLNGEIFYRRLRNPRSRLRLDATLQGIDGVCRWAKVTAPNNLHTTIT